MRIICFFRNLSINLLSGFEIVFFMSFLWEMSTKTLLIVEFIMLILSFFDYFKKFNGINQLISCILLSLFLTYLTLHLNRIGYFLVNDIKVNNRITFSVLIVTLVVIVLLFVRVYFFEKKEESICASSLIILTTKLVIEFCIFFTGGLFIQTMIYLNYRNVTLFEVLGTVNFIIFCYLLIKKEKILIVWPFHKTYREISIINIVQTFICFFGGCLLWGSNKNDIKNAFLIVAIIGLSLGVLYWTDLGKIFGDNYFGIILIIVNLIPFCVFGLYDQGNILGKTSLTTTIFGIIFLIGAVLLAIVGEDVQNVNGIDLADIKNKELKVKIARYRLRISNGIVLATFINTLFSDETSVKKFGNWLADIVNYYFGRIDTTWILVFILIVSLIFIFVGSKVLSYLEVKAFRKF